eukprot:1109626-Pyramimonas_sp.AAC.1
MLIFRSSLISSRMAHARCLSLAPIQDASLARLFQHNHREGVCAVVSKRRRRLRAPDSVAL